MTGEAMAAKVFPRGAAIGFALLIGISLAVAATGRLTGAGVTQERPAAVVASRALHFEDAGEGLVLVRDAGTGRVVEQLEPGTDNFIRGVLRGMARERRAEGVDRSLAFVVQLEADDTLALVDEGTGRRINLNAFGPTNREAFRRLLEAGRTAP